MKFTILADLSLVIITINLVCLFNAWESRENRLFKKVMHFTMIYMATPLHKNPCPWGHEIYNFLASFLGHHNYIFSLSDLCLGVEKKVFKEIMQFHYKTYMATPLYKNPCPWGHEIYNFF